MMPSKVSISAIKGAALRSRKPAPKRRASSRKPNTRKVGAENSLTRAAFLDAAENLLRDEGYAAVTTRRLAKRAGLRPQLVHYYFRSMDDLLVALWQRVADRNLQIHLREMASGRPLRAIWECNRDARDTTLTLEFLALARHRAKLRREIAKEGERFREKTVELLSKELPKPTLKRVELSPALLSVLITSVSRMLVMESAVGLSYGHTETRRFVERWLGRLENHPAAEAPERGRT